MCPGKIYAEDEQKQTPALTQRVEQTYGDKNGSKPTKCRGKQGLTLAKGVRRTIMILRRGEYLITTGLETRLLLNNMRGGSPKENCGSGLDGPYASIAHLARCREEM